MIPILLVVSTANTTNQNPLRDTYKAAASIQGHTFVANQLTAGSGVPSKLVDGTTEIPSGVLGIPRERQGGCPPHMPPIRNCTRCPHSDRDIHLKPIRVIGGRSAVSVARTIFVLSGDVPYERILLIKKFLLNLLGWATNAI